MLRRYARGVPPKKLKKRDDNQGIRFQGYSIPELQQKLPKAVKDGEPLPEALYWLLLTGEIPTKAQTDSITAEWNARAALPEHVIKMLDNFPKHMHPMTQFSAAVTALNTESAFAAAYANVSPYARLVFPS